MYTIPQLAFGNMIKTFLQLRGCSLPIPQPSRPAGLKSRPFRAHFCSSTAYAITSRQRKRKGYENKCRINRDCPWEISMWTKRFINIHRGKSSETIPASKHGFSLSCNFIYVRNNCWEKKLEEKISKKPKPTSQWSSFNLHSKMEFCSSLEQMVSSKGLPSHSPTTQNLLSARVAENKQDMGQS